MLVVTAGIAPWNTGVAYVTGLVLDHAHRRSIIKLG
jgi:hypothetical protein